MRSKWKSCERARWRRSFGLAAGATLLLGLVGPPVAAQEAGEESPEREAESHAVGEAGEHEEHEFHRHHLSVFLGATTADVAEEGEHGGAGIESEGGEVGEETRTETDGTIGLDYEYRFSRAWGLVTAFEWVGGDARNWMVGIGPAFHPVAGLKLFGGPGFEHNDAENEFIFRVGLGYEFDVGRWSLTPAFNLDFVDGEQTYVYGLYVGKGF